MKNSEINVFNFTDYRQFLKSTFVEKKMQNKQWSYSSWAKKLDLAGTATLTMVINGERNPGKSLSQKLTSYYDFSKQEEKYFLDLIKLEKIKKDPRLSLLLIEDMKKNHQIEDFFRLDLKSFEAISCWYFSALREMVRLKDFKEDSHWIAKKLCQNISPKKIKKSIESLLELGMLKRNSKHKLIQGVNATSTSEDIASEAIKVHHEQMITLANQAIRKCPVQERSITGTSFCLNRKNIPKAKKLISDFRTQFLQIVEEQQGESIYQLNIQLFPLTGEDQE